VKLNRPSVFIAGAVTALTLGGGTAYAANGGSFLLGRSNTATTATTLTNTAGTPLSLKARTGYPPLAVSSSKTVPSLSADLLDGLSSASFLRSTGKAADAEKVDGINGASIALTTGRTGVVYGSSSDVDHMAITARCPAGTIATGGGGAADYDGDALAYSGPDFDEVSGVLIPNSWLAMDASGSGATAWVVCYNPRGAVPGAGTMLPAAAKATAARQQARVAAHQPQAASSGR
jgi:hypothetical protein